MSILSILSGNLGEMASELARLGAEVERLNQVIADAGDMAAEIRRAQRAEDFVKSDNARLRAEVKRQNEIIAQLMRDNDSELHKSVKAEAENARLRAAISESIADVRGAQFTDNTWKEAEAEKRGILAGLENALKGGER